jgi:hypothetical protein
MILRDRIGIDLGQRNRIEDGIHTAIDHGARFLDRHVSLVMLAFAMMAAIRHQVNRSIPKKTKQYPQKFPALIRWSIQEVRRIAQCLAQRRINLAYIIAWSLWRRAHQAATQKSYIKIKSQL